MSIRAFRKPKNVPIDVSRVYESVKDGHPLSAGMLAHLERGNVGLDKKVTPKLIAILREQMVKEWEGDRYDTYMNNMRALTALGMLYGMGEKKAANSNILGLAIKVGVVNSAAYRYGNSHGQVRKAARIIATTNKALITREHMELLMQDVGRYRGRHYRDMYLFIAKLRPDLVLEGDLEHLHTSAEGLFVMERLIRQSKRFGTAARIEQLKGNVWGEHVGTRQAAWRVATTILGFKADLADNVIADAAAKAGAYDPSAQVAATAWQALNAAANARMPGVITAKIVDLGLKTAIESPFGNVRTQAWSAMHAALQGTPALLTRARLKRIRDAHDTESDPEAATALNFAFQSLSMVAGNAAPTVPAPHVPRLPLPVTQRIRRNRVRPSA